MAVVERADMEVVVEFGVPLWMVSGGSGVEVGAKSNLRAHI